MLDQLPAMAESMVQMQKQTQEMSAAVSKITLEQEAQRNLIYAGGNPGASGL